MKKYCLMAVVLLCGILSGCKPTPKIENVQGYAQGTTYSISWWSEKPVSQQLIIQDFQQTLDQIDKELSTWRDDSFISQFNQSQSTDWVPASADFIHLLRVAQNIYQKTNGCYDPTIGPLFDLWGFKKGSLEVPTAEQIAVVKAEMGLFHMHINDQGNAIRKDLPSLAIDFSSMGEGYTIGKLSNILEKHGIFNYLVEFGGDMKIHGAKPDDKSWRVGIKLPAKPEVENTPYRIAEIIARDGVTINTSGTYSHSFDKDGRSYSHILDPRTGKPIEHYLVSASVFGEVPEITDAWATAMLCVGENEGLVLAKDNNLAVLFITKKGDKISSFQSPKLDSDKRVLLEKGE